MCQQIYGSLLNFEYQPDNQTANGDAGNHVTQQSAATGEDEQRQSRLGYIKAKQNTSTSVAENRTLEMKFKSLPSMVS